MARRERRYPVPEAIDGGSWSIRDAREGAHCSPDARALAVPLGGACADCGEDHARATRAHEMAHAALSPVAKKVPKGLDQDLLLPMEDRRIELWLESENVRTGELMVCEPVLEANARAAIGESLRAAVGYGLCAPDWRTAEIIRRGMEDEDSDRARKVRALVNGAHGILVRGRRRRARPTFADVVKAIEWLQPLLEAEEEEEERRQGAADKGEEEPEEARGVLEALENLESKGFTPQVPKGPEPWGTMTIEQPSLVVAVRTDSNAPRWRYTSAGSIPRATWRLPIDGRPFGKRIRQPGGTILCDLSGSMSAVEPELCRRVVLAAPSATIAGYRGIREGVDDDKLLLGIEGGTGKLWVILDGGRRISDRNFADLEPAGWNIIDGPALEWLGRQPAPRVWVSDGFASGKSGDVSETMIAVAAKIAARAGAWRVDTLDDALAVVTRGGRRRRG